VLEARVHSAQIQDREGIKLLLDIAARDRLPGRLSHPRRSTIRHHSLGLDKASDIPAVIAAAGFWVNAQQRDREQKLANEHAEDEPLKAYLDQMLQLLLDKDTPLSQSKEGDEVRTLARAWTLTVLLRLRSGLRKRSVTSRVYGGEDTRMSRVGARRQRRGRRFARSITCHRRCTLA
jgi:hypothetical protein